MSGKNHDDHYVDALLEDINHKFDALMEGLASLASVPGDIAQLKYDMSEVKNDIKAMKAVLTNHEGRIIRLEDVVLP